MYITDLRRGESCAKLLFMKDADRIFESCAANENNL